MKLSKREIIFLTLLLIIGLAFVEYRFVIIPGIDRYEALLDENQKLDAEISTITLNLQIAEKMKSQRDENLQVINGYSQKFLDSLQVSVLLHFTHEMMERNGFTPSSYTIQPLTVESPNPDTVTIDIITYQLAELVEHYKNIRSEQPVENETDNDGDTSGDEESIQIIAQIEKIEFMLTVTGTYEQIKDLLNDIQSQEKSLLMSQLNINASTEDMITAQMNIQYYGLEKIDSENNEYNTWPRSGFDSGVENPFGIPIIETEETVVTESDQETEETNEEVQE